MGWAAAGAGRKPSTEKRRNGSHRAREEHSRAHPLHVVLRSKVRSLRSQFMFPTVRRALAHATRARHDFRIVRFSVQADHVHLIVEAESNRALSRAMQGLAVRVARALNQLLSRRGALRSDRFYARPLTSPRAVNHAVKYVLSTIDFVGKKPNLDQIMRYTEEVIHEYGLAK